MGHTYPIHLVLARVSCPAAYTLLSLHRLYYHWQHVETYFSSTCAISPPSGQTYPLHRVTLHKRDTLTSREAGHNNGCYKCRTCRFESMAVSTVKIKVLNVTED